MLPPFGYNGIYYAGMEYVEIEHIIALFDPASLSQMGVGFHAKQLMLIQQTIHKYTGRKLRMQINGCRHPYVGHYPGPKSRSTQARTSTIFPINASPGPCGGLGVVPPDAHGLLGTEGVGSENASPGPYGGGLPPRGT